VLTRSCPHYPRLQRGRAHGGAETASIGRSSASAPLCFNGAAPTGARRPHHLRRGHAGLELASTGPRPRGRGDLAASDLGLGCWFPLQRGRAHGGAETGLAPVTCKRCDGASTGPRPRGRGDQPRRTATDRLLPSFNGAAPTGARRHSGMAMSRMSSSELQRGRAHGGAETSNGMRTRLRRFQASTGPRPRGRGDAQTTVCLTDFSEGFNGAAPTGARRLIRSPGWTRGALALQRGRAHGGAETLQLAGGHPDPLAASTGPRPRGRGDSAHRQQRSST